MRVKAVHTGWLQIQNEANFRKRQERIRLEIHALKPATAFPFNMSNVYGKGCKKLGERVRRGIYELDNCGLTSEKGNYDC